MPETPDPVAAELAAIEDRLEHAVKLAETFGEHADLREFAAKDAPRLLGAVGAVLVRHQPKTVTVREMCSAHAWGTKAGHSVSLAKFRDEVDACPDCTSREQVECTGCNPECPDDNVWENCPERAGITAKLLGKEESDGLETRP
jgi:hypothetical protein